MAVEPDHAASSASSESFEGSTREFRQRLRNLASDATPEAAAEFARRFFKQLGKALAPSSDVTIGSTDSTAGPHAVLAFIVREVGTASSSASTSAEHSPGQPGAAWLVEYWAAPQGTVVGRLHEGVSTVRSMLLGRPVSAQVEAASFQDLLDMLLQRRSPVMAIARRRIVISGDFMAAVQKLKPALSAAVQALSTELPEMEEELLSTTSRMASSVMWMPNDASPSCPLCGLRWRPVLRQRHHCRSCGTLVCGKCSTRHATTNGARWCISCAGAHYSSNRGVASFVSSTTTGATSRSASFASTATNGHHASSFCEDRGCSTQSGRTPGDMPELPSGSETHGVLFAHVNNTFGANLQTLISATPPSEREQRLWDKLLQAEAAAARPEQAWRLLAKRLLSSALQFALHVSMCFALCKAATLCAHELPEKLIAVWGVASRRLPTLLTRALLGLFFTSSAVVLSMTRALLVLTVTAVYIWSFCLGATNGEVELAGFPTETLLSQAFVQYPKWGSLCCLVTLTVVASSRYLGRLAEIYLTATVPISIYWGCKLLQRIFFLSDSLAQSLLYDLADSIVAPFLVERFLALGGLFVKVGQWAANVSVGVPTKLQDQLKRLTDSAPFDTEAHVRSLLLQEFGQPIDELFAKFDVTPIASASIAQVHRAVLRSDDMEQEVAVKLQHANVETIMLSDLVALTRIIRFCCWLGGEKWQGTKTLFESWAKDMVHELDFRHEVNNLKEVRAGLLAAGVDVVVPAPIDGWVSKRAFLMEFCRGFRFTDMDRLVLHAVDRKALGARALQAAACQMLELGVFNSDPHSGNLLCQERGDSAVPVLLDFGNCVRLTDDQRLAYCRLLVSISEGSVTKVQEAMGAMHFQSTQSETHPERDLEYMLMLFRDTGSRAATNQARKDFVTLRNRQRDEDYAALGANTKKEKKKVAKQVQRYPRHVPDEFILFIRMMYLVRGLCTQLDAELPFLQIFECHARRALLALCPRAQRAFSWLSPSQLTGGTFTDATHVALRQRIRHAIARCCAERPGLGVQVCVHVGRRRVADECGGCLGMVDPRPMAHDSLMPLADLSRLLPLLAVLTEVRAGRLSYSMKASGLLNRKIDIDGADPSCSQSSSASAPALKHVLAHCALENEGKAREALAATSAADLHKPELMHGRVAAALSSEVAQEAEASYMPLGTGYVASAAVEAARGEVLGTVLAQLPGVAGMERELGLCADGNPTSMATLSSSLFTEFRTLLATGGAGSDNKRRLFGSFHDASSSAPTRPSEPVETKKEPTRTNPFSSIGSIVDYAGGLLVDPMLAVPAMQAAARAESAGLSSSGVRLCPDLACVASARALAAVLAAADPAGQRFSALGCEPRRDNTTGTGQFGAISSLLGLAPREWDERGFEIFNARGSGDAVAVGLTAARGLLGLAVQWRASGSRRNPVTVAVLTNDLSTDPVPFTLLSEVAEVLNLPVLASLPR